MNCPLCGQLQDPAKLCGNAQCKADISEVKSPTHGLRFHDLRHHAITELAESQASEQTIMAIAGHVSRKMLAHYSHVRLEAKRKALDALTQRKKEQGYDTKSDTNTPAQQLVNPQVVEINGRPGRTRTSDLFRVNLARLQDTTTYSEQKTVFQALLPVSQVQITGRNCRLLQRA